MPPVALPTGCEPVPRLWPRSTIACVGSGPSLTKADCQRLRAASSAVRVLAVNDAIDRVPWADALFAGDAKWWGWRRGMADAALPPLLFTLQRAAVAARPRVHVLNYSGGTGIETHPGTVRTGGHSGYAAINVAVHLGAAQILLLGYDLQPGAHGAHHFFGDHPDKSHLRYDARLAAYEALAAALAAVGVSIVNCTRRTAITQVPAAPLAAVL